MKSKMALAVALFAGVLLAGCESATRLNSIQIGMSKDQVQSILGTPDSTSAQANVEYLTYYLDTDANSRDRAYMVRLVNGKVESFGRFAQLFDLYNRPVTSALPGQPDFPQSAYNPAGGAPGAAFVGVQGAGAKPDLVAELTKLKALKDQGVLTDEEFQKAKAKLLAEP